MDWIRSLKKYAFDIFLFNIGLTLIIYGLVKNQNSYFIIVCGLIIVFAILSFLLNYGVIKKSVMYTIIFVCVLPIAGALAYMNYISVQGKIELENKAEQRRSIVTDRLLDVRKAQLAHRSVTGLYANNFDALITFVDTAKFPIIKKIGQIPDSLEDMTEEEAVVLGIIERDTSYVGVRDSIFAADYPLDSIRYAPFTGGKQFVMVADTVPSGPAVVPAFQASVKLMDIYAGLDIENIAPYKNWKKNDSLRIGSINKDELHTNGNW